MKTLVVYYSRSGTTKKVGDTVAAMLDCDSEEIFDLKNRKGLFGWLSSGRNAMRKRLVPIRETRVNPAGYELVVIGTPVFASKMAAPVRTYISQNRDTLKQVAFFCTAGGDGFDRPLADLAEFAGQKPAAVLGLRNEEVKKGLFEEKAKKFTEALR